MHHPTPTTTSRHRLGRARSGQALIEVTFVLFMMAVLLFGLIDFGRVIYEKQILVNVSREGANLASRGSGNSQLEIISNAVSAVIVSANPLVLTNTGCVIISAVVNSNNIIKVVAQVSEGPMRATSKIGSVGANATMPAGLPPTNTTCYISEVFNTFAPITPLGKLLKFTMPTTNYDVAYF